MSRSSPYVEVAVGERTVRVSNPDKVFFSTRGRTKLDLVHYYLAVGEGIVAALRDRPTYLKRHPDGAQGEAIYQKRVPRGHPQWLPTAQVTFPSGRTAEVLCVTELAAVIYCANLGTIDFHPWPARCGDTDHPDELRIDLDPQPGTGFGEARRAASVVAELLDELGYTGYPKTSGGRGIHVCLRIQPRWDFIQVRRAGLALARETERRAPSLVTTAWWKEERGEKVFLDYNQNARDRTVASAYSVRAFLDAPVSTPVTWAELADIDPRDFTMDTVPARYAEFGDIHAGLDRQAFSLEPLLEMADRDERDHGLGDMPYPPNYPKMAGEPSRVQPSRARRSPQENAGS